MCAHNVPLLLLFSLLLFVVAVAVLVTSAFSLLGIDLLHFSSEGVLVSVKYRQHYILPNFRACALYMAYRFFDKFL